MFNKLEYIQQTIKLGVFPAVSYQGEIVSLVDYSQNHDNLFQFRMSYGYTNWGEVDPDQMIIEI